MFKDNSSHICFTFNSQIFLFYYFPTSYYHYIGRDAESFFKVPENDAIYAGFKAYVPGRVFTREQIIKGVSIGDYGNGHFGCNKYSYSWYSGSMCSTLILLDGKISKDYPW